jgi:segregation and condensation protein A
MPYQVQLAVFEGPLDLLLHLIEREEMEITAVSVAQIANQYLAYLAMLQERDADDLADFLVMAARLLWIKSRALLPQPPQAISDEDEEDPAEVLARQLRDYRRFKEAAVWLQSRESEGLRAYVRTAPPPALPTRMTPGQLTAEDLLQAMRELLSPSSALEPVDKMMPPVRVTITQQVGRIIRATRGGGTVRFRHLLAKAMSRIEIVVTLLALLELVKRQEVIMSQQQMFGDIVISGLQGSAASRPEGGGAASSARAGGV